MKTKKIIARVSAWLLMIAMLAVCVPTTIFATTSTLNDSLLIHYDFEGDALATQLSDKAKYDAEQTATDLTNAYSGVVGGEGDDKNNPKLANEIGEVFSVTDGVVKAKNSGNAALVAPITDDTKAMHVADTPSELTVYVRMKVTNWSASFSMPISMRKNGGGDAVFCLMINNNGLTFVSDGGWVSPNPIPKATVDADGDNWVDIAVVRSKASEAKAKDSFKIYALNAGTWSQVGTATGSVGHNTVSAAELKLCLFNDINNNAYAGGAPACQLDDVRVYSKALSIANLDEVASEVHGTVANNLLIHYDFEGDTLNKQLADKAGDTKSDLTVKAADTAQAYSELFKIEDGVVTAVADTTYVADNSETTENESLKNKFLLVATNTSDVEATYGKEVSGTRDLNGTWYIRVKVPNHDTRDVSLLFNRNMASPTANATDTERNVYIRANSGKIYVNHGTNARGETAYTKDTWMEIAFVRNGDAKTESVYLRTADAWKCVYTGTYNNIPKNIDTAFALFGHLESNGSITNWTGNIKGLAYDDVRFYDAALTTYHLTQIVNEEKANLAWGDLLIHYDFNGNTWEEKLSDKAGSIKTNLTAISKGSTVAIAGAAPTENVLSQTDAEEIFKIGKTDENDTIGIKGVATSLKSGKNVGALISGITEDTKAIQADKSSATWFIRVKLPNSGTENIPLNFRNTTVNERPLYTIYNADTDKLTVYYGTSIATANSKEVSLSKAEDAWMNMALVRSYNTETSKYDYTFLYKVDDATGWTVAFTDSQSVMHTSDKTIISLFANAANQQADVFALTEMSIDDVRVYNSALTEAHLNAIVADTDTYVGAANTEEVTMLGAQRSKNNFNVDGVTTYKVRLVAQIAGDTWTNAGFKVSLENGNQDVDLAATKAYTSLVEELDGGLKSEIKAAEGCYLIAVVIDGIPADAYDAITLTVVPYVKAAEGDPIEGDGIVVTLANSEIESVTWAQ